MKVYEVVPDTNTYRRFLPADPEVWKTDLLVMDCDRKASGWRPPAIYVPNPKLKRGNFTRLSSGAFVVDSVAFESLAAILERSGELLPLTHEGEMFYLVNVLECVNCLDHDATEWTVDKTTGERIGIERFKFMPARMGESTLFKLPENSRGRVLTVTGIKDPEDEFKFAVEQAGLTGLLFKELWSTE